MRGFLLLILVALLARPAAAEPPSKTAMDRTPPTKVLPLKGATSGNPCAAFGPGFVRIEGTGTCVKIGGAIDVGVGTSVGGRR